jgi:hypothetical protein
MTSSVHAATMDDVLVERLRTEFRRPASICGEPEPTDIRYVFSTFQIADTAVYGAPSHTNSHDPNTPVVVAAGRGSFVVPRSAPRVPRPTGQHLTVIWVLPDGGITAYSISQHAPDLSALGTFISI